MDNSVFDIFSAAKNLLFLGNYEESLKETESTDITEEDTVQVIRKKFYMFLCLLEEDKQNDLNNMLMELKDSKDSTKIYYNIFRVYLIYYIKRTYKEELLAKIYNDLIKLDNVGPFLQPAVYLIALMLLDLDDKERFLHIVKLQENDPEIIMLKIFYFLKMNKIKEASGFIDILNLKDSESVNTVLSTVFIDFFQEKSMEKTLKTLAEIKNNNKMTPKLFNIISLALMHNGAFKDAIKPLTLGIDACMNTGGANQDMITLMVNLICCYRNLGEEENLRDTEEKLRSLSPKNKYFEKLSNFDEEFEKL